MKEELYAFKCKECGQIYLEPYDPTDRFAKYPNCSDCGSRQIEVFDGELTEDLQRLIDEYISDDEVEV